MFRTNEARNATEHIVVEFEGNSYRVFQDGGVEKLFTNSDSGHWVPVSWLMYPKQAKSAQELALATERGRQWGGFKRESPMIKIEFKGEVYRAWKDGRVERESKLPDGRTTRDELFAAEVETIKAVQVLARQTEEGRDWGALPARVFKPRRPYVSDIGGPSSRRYGSSNRLAPPRGYYRRRSASFR